MPNDYGILRVTKCVACPMKIVVGAHTTGPVWCPKCAPAVFDDPPRPVPSIAEAMRDAGLSPQEDTNFRAPITWASLAAAFRREGFDAKWTTEFMRPMIDRGMPPERFAGFPEHMGKLLRDGCIIIADNNILVTAKGRAVLGDGVIPKEDPPPDIPCGGDDEPWRAA